MGMDTVHLEPEEREFLLKFKEPIGEQLGLMRRCVESGKTEFLPDLIAELTMFTFTLGREFQKEVESGT